MEHKRRQSTTCSEELFEFVDFTSVSNFERLSTALEEIFSSWGTKDGDYGIFADNTQAPSDASEKQQQQQHKQTQEYSRSEYVCTGDKTYKLTYYCHPYAFRRREQQQRHDTSTHNNTHLAPFAYPDFSFLSQQTTADVAENNAETHPLHRWTGFDRLFVLTLAQGSFKTKLFSQGRNTVELPQAKKLLSACVVAIQSVKCQVPVFVPVGQGRHGMYIGYLLGKGEGESQSDDDLHDVEFRFNTSLTYSITPKDTRLDGLFGRFSQKMDIFYEDRGLIPIKDADKDCKAAGAFTYICKNFFDENWKTLDGWGEQLIGRPPSLPFGSYNDPLRALMLKTMFPLAALPVYMDNTTQTNMNLLTSHHWYLAREIAPKSQQRAFLSSLLDNLISSWIKDPGNRDYLSPYDSSNENGKGGGGDNGDTNSNADARDRTDPGLVRNLLHAVSSNRGRATVQTSETPSPADHVDHVLRALFMQEADCPHDTYANEEMKLLTSSGLAFRLRHGTPVPYRSFFWNFLFYALHAMSDPSKIQAHSYISFLGALWMQVLRQIRWHWENVTLIPNVDTALYQQQNDAQKEYPDVCGIDLRYSILHQKIAMINCCIERYIRDGMRWPKSDSQQRKPVSTLLDDLMAVQKPDQALDNAPNKFNSFLNRLVDGDEELQKEKHEISAHNDNIDVDEDERSELSDGDLFFDPLEDFDDLTKKSTRASPVPHKSTHSDKTMKFPSRSSSSSDVSELAHPQSMSESFVRLNYPSSAESYNARRYEFLPDKRPPCYEVEDPDGSEGCKYEHPSLRLLKTDEPMCIPETQDGGFMTEDMIEQQASVLESLGTSGSATRLRAKLQSAQLFSDMQAFKAANPHALLEDFVRWHSPRDWVEKEKGKGYLSARMSDPKNIWQELWKCSPRTPADKQKPLFDAFSEGEKALHYLETLSIQEIFAMLLPTVSLIAYDTLVSHPIAQRVKIIVQGMHDLSEDIINFRWDELKIGKSSIAPLIFTIRKQEAFMCNAISLLRKLPDQEALVDRLLSNPETEVLDGPERDTVLDLFVAEQPSCREYVLYSSCTGVGPDDRPLPLRQYAMVKDNELRIVDMHCTDTRYQ